MTHSPEPWHTEFWHDGPRHIVDSNNKPVAGYCVDFDGFNAPVYSSVDDMERIVACVNACRNIPSNFLTNHQFVSVCSEDGIAYELYQDQ